MELRRKPNILRAALCLTALAMIGCLLGAASIAYGRYYERITESVSFTVHSKAEVQLYAARDEGGAGDASTPQWTLDAEFTSQTLTCLLSNGYSGETAAAEDLSFRLRLYLPETDGLADDQTDPLGSLSIKLQTEQDGQTVEYTAESEYLRQKSAVYREKGAGWVYVFTDAEGNEPIFLLEGGQLSDLPITLTAEVTTAGTTVILTDYKLLIDQIHTD